MLTTSDFDFDLPEDLIASHPLVQRDASRMLIVNGNDISDGCVRNFLEFLQPGDVVVFNNSRVIPARFIADGKYEITLHTATSDGCWWGLCKRFGKIKVGTIFTLDDGTQIEIIENAI